MDLRGLLASTTLGGQTQTYSYDGQGKRLSASDGSQTTRFIWDVTSRVPELVREENGAGGLVRRYVYGADLVSMTDPSGSFFYHNDALGSVRNLTDSAGQVSHSYDYEPFGTEPSPPAGSPVNPMRFTGEYLDETTGLYHLRARQYDPSLGRFLSFDPLSPALTTPYISAYAYVNNGPITWVDPTGLRGESADCGSHPDGFWYGVSDFFAGFGDFATTITFTDFSLTRWIRGGLGGNEVVDMCSGLYQAGGVAGTVNVALIGTAGGVRALGFNARFGVHTAHVHKGLPHLQVNLWRPGVKAWGKRGHLPLPSSLRKLDRDWGIDLWPRG